MVFQNIKLSQNNTACIIACSTGMNRFQTIHSILTLLCALTIEWNHKSSFIPFSIEIVCSIIEGGPVYYLEKGNYHDCCISHL